MVQRTLSVDNESSLWFANIRLLCMQCPKFFFLIKDGADLRMGSFSCKQSLHPLSPGANGFTFLTKSPFDVEIDVFVFFLISKRDR